MKLKCIALLGLGLVVTQAYAAQSIVIDSQQVGESSTAPKTDAAAPAQTNAPSAESNEAAKARAQAAGARISSMEKMQIAKASVGESNKQEGVNFLAANKTKKGVVTLADGLQYKILRAGKGKKPKEESTVMARYKGTLTDGSSIDKTDEKKPSPLLVKGLLPGLKEAVKLMPSGSKWEVVVPPELAYGAKGNRGVGPNAVLVYQIEIVGIK